MDEFYQNIIRQFPYLTEEKVLNIISGSEVRMLEAGEIFIKTGEKSRKVAYVLQGLMRNYTLDQDGEEVTVHFAAETQSIAPYTAVFLGTPATETTQAVENTMVIVLDFQEVRQKAQHDPIVLRLYADMIEFTLINAIQRIEDFTQKSPEQRYQRVLDTQAYLIDRAPLKYLASYLGITAVSLSRIRKRLTKSRN
jgi:CRP-like cAMP-binding protein